MLYETLIFAAVRLTDELFLLNENRARKYRFFLCHLITGGILTASIFRGVSFMPSSMKACNKR